MRATSPYDWLQTMYRTMLGYGAVAILILVVGLVEFVHFEPPGQVSGSHARIVGVFDYNHLANSTYGPDSNRFPRSQEFAAVVDWSSIPPGTEVDARWFNGFGETVGQVGPATPLDLPNPSIVAVRAPKGLTHNLPGHYIFVVERLQDGQAVEVLARRIVLVERN